MDAGAGEGEYGHHSVAGLHGPDQLGYRWSKDESNETTIVFIKEEHHA